MLLNKKKNERMNSIMAFDIIKEQRMIRTLFYSLIHSANFLADRADQKQKFIQDIATFVRERSMVEDDTRDKCELVKETLEMFGWKSTKIDYLEGETEGRVFLGKNRYIPNDLADSQGALIVLQAFIEGLCFHLIKAPVDARAELSLRTGSFYEITFTRSSKEATTPTYVKKTPHLAEETIDMSIHDNLTIEQLFYPIFTREIPTMILFDAAWKVIRESYVANALGSELAEQEELKKPSIRNISIIIKKLTEKAPEEEILNMAEIIGEFFAKFLKTKISDALYDKLQPTLKDKHATSYLVYYDCKQFCSNDRFINRCIFIRGMWTGILSEVLGFPIQIKEVLHAGKRDRYCMIEFEPEKNA
ncbi:hypothetical protein DRO91_03890 [Candidatus Heimdallarchaeota archaeon]|nr:MAG: hypothetical protein DRO63_01540 [Candidatus Gerdarchaeota archaeon]RLI72954.1 MAG: hypothetical protein DRP02_00150 [Candidatus Gerdarchaeota archaeon]RLI73006.1 MAG: hypothetical protein DRO91_03890 [Candidatus Heimdallarchaeota archaeon]